MNTHTPKNKPIKKFQAGAVSATIWENQNNKDQGTYRSVSFDRAYKDKSGSWKTTNSLRTTDLPKAQIVLKKAYEFLVLKEGVENNSKVFEIMNRVKANSAALAQQLN